MTLAERKVMGAMQRRIGPNQVGYLGLLQPFSDGIKLILKETILPLESNKNLFLAAPYLIFFLALLNWLILPLDENLILSELYGGGILIFITISELSIYGILFSGWSANSKYPFLGGLRSTAQMISYSVSLSLIFLIQIFLNGTVNLIDFFSNQSVISNFFPLFPIAILFIISAIAETNRAPFDLPEAKLLVLFNPTICWKISLKKDLNILLEILSAINHHFGIFRDYMWDKKNSKIVFEEIVQNIYLQFILFFKSIYNYSDQNLIFKDYYKKSGIYGFKCKMTNDLYIGSAINLEKRIKEHLKGTKSNILLQRALKKYGLINFEIIIYEIVEVNDLKKLYELEDKYIEYLKPTYNIRPFAQSMLGYKYSKLRMSEAHKNVKNQKIFDLEIGKKISIQDFMTKEILYTCDSITKLANSQNVNKSTVGRYIKKNKIWKNKYIFKYGK